MDAFHAAGESEAARSLLRHAQHRAYAAGAEMMFSMSSLGTGLSELAEPLGYRRWPVVYHFVVWPRGVIAAGSPAADPEQWRFPYSDHDAF